MAETKPADPGFTWQQVLKIRIISFVGWALIRVIGRTLRLQVEEPDRFRAIRDRKETLILAFWHNQIFIATYVFRELDIAVITSQHFDGEYIGRIINLFGYEAVRGSSTRGGVRALLDLKRRLVKGQMIGITCDGPKGPRYRAKPGPVFLSRKTGLPIVPFHLEPEKFWALKSWDRFRIPKPFSRVVLKLGKPLVVAETEDEEEGLTRLQAEMERLLSLGSEYWQRATD